MVDKRLHDASSDHFTSLGGRLVRVPEHAVFGEAAIEPWERRGERGGMASVAWQVTRRMSVEVGAAAARVRGLPGRS